MVDVTALLMEWSNGDPRALEKLTPVVYQELHALAESHMRRERGDHTLQTTALVHEVYLKLCDQRKVNWTSRSHFYGVAAKIMRRILVDHAKSAKAGKRGGSLAKTILTDNVVAVSPDKEVLDLDEALNRLEELDARKAHVVELKFFGGMTSEESAQFLGISLATVERDWTMAKAWLYRELQRKSKEP